MHFLTSCKQCFESNISWKVLEKGFSSPGKPWNVVFASPGKSWKKHLNVCTNPGLMWCVCCGGRLPDGLMKLANLTQLSLNDASVAALPEDIGRSTALMLHLTCSYVNTVRDVVVRTLDLRPTRH